MAAPATPVRRETEAEKTINCGQFEATQREAVLEKKRYPDPVFFFFKKKV